MSVASDSLLDEESQQKIADITMAAESASANATSEADYNSIWDSASSQANAVRDSVNAGYTATPTGETVQNTTTTPTPTNNYTSAYAEQIESVLSSLLTNSYEDWKLSDEYASLSDTYTAKGETAMTDTLGQVASRTGGMASSYATTAGQQTYNNYMEGLESAAQNAYDGHSDDLYNQLSMLVSLDDGEYSRLRDQVSDEQYAQQWDYGVERDAVDDSRYDTEWNYGVERDQVNDGLYSDETAYNQALTKAQTLASYGDFSGYSALGYTDGEIAAMKQGYQSSSYSGVSGVSGVSGDVEEAVEQDYANLYADALASGNAQSFISNNYKDYGFSSSSGLYSDYKLDAESGMDSDTFSVLMTSIRGGMSSVVSGGALSGADEGATIAQIEKYWDSLSYAQKAELNTLLGKYGFEYQE